MGGTDGAVTGHGSRNNVLNGHDPENEHDPELLTSTNSTFIRLPESLTL